MTLDLSNLTPEKRAFLKAHPDLLKSLETGMVKQAGKVQNRKLKEQRGKSKLQRDLDCKVEKIKDNTAKLRRKYDPHLMRIQSSFISTLDVDRGTKGVVCPVCGRSDEECGHNKMNGKPWCFKCNSPLIPKSKLKKWRKTVVKALRPSLKDEFKRRGLDF